MKHVDRTDLTARSMLTTKYTIQAQCTQIAHSQEPAAGGCWHQIAHTQQAQKGTLDGVRLTGQKMLRVWNAHEELRIGTNPTKGEA